MMAPRNPVAALYYGRHHWDFRLGNYLALLRTMGITSMVTRLYNGTALRNQTFSRLKRTRELIATLVVYGLESEPGELALTRIRHAHRNVTANTEEYKYVLSVFFLEPLRWNGAYGKQPMTAGEKSLLLAFWMKVGDGLKVSDLEPNLEAWLAFQQRYEAEHLGRTPEGRALAKSSLAEVVRLVIPRGMQELTRQALLGTMQPEVRAALDLPPAWLPPRLTLSTLRVLACFGAGRRVPTLVLSGSGPG